MKKDPYDVLGVSRDATPEEINKAYKKLSRLYHADRNPGDEEAKEKYQEVQDALDQIEGKGRRSSPFENVNSWVSSWTTWNPFASEPEEGRDIRMPKVVNVSLTVEEVVKGVKKLISYRKGACEACRGNGAKDGIQQSCLTCKGQGRRVQKQGNFSLETPCNSCGGRGKITIEKCKKCEGYGTGPMTEKEVEIPAGLKHGQHIRFDDVIVVVEILPHQFFTIGMVGLEVTVPITPAQAMAKSTVRIPTPTGSVTVKVPPEAINGALLRIKGHGVNGSDMYVKFQIVVDIKTQVGANLEAYQCAALADEQNPPERIVSYQNQMRDWIAEKSPEPTHPESSRHQP